MNDAIMRFLAAKGTDAFKQDEDKFFDYPMQAVVDGKQDTLYINDVVREYDDKQHKLTVIAIHRGLEDTIFTITKTCVAPPDCIIDWDTVHCATSIEV